ncbi:MAG: carbohydrate porin, partial [Rhodoplanes sp.]
RIRRDYVGGINTIAAIEAVPTGRLSELWLEQSLWNGGASLRAGQLAADAEFFFADAGLMFLQTDWPTITAAALPSGGPAYPLSTPGVRVKVDPNKNVSVLAAVFNGDPAGPGTLGDEQLRNKYGVNFRLKDSPFVIAEAQFRTNQGKTDTGLASTLKLGAWTHFGKFDDNRFADDGTLLADPEGSGEPLKRRGNNGVYGVFEQQLYRPHGGDARSGITLFGLASGSPQDRSLINFWFQTGLVFAGMIPNRPDDKFGAIFEYARYSNSVRAFEQDQIAFTGIPEVIQDYEANLELNYLFQIVPGWTLQPVLTYVWHPDGGASAVDALVIGARSIWHY